MALICHEDGSYLLAADAVFGVTTRFADTYSAICAIHRKDFNPAIMLSEPAEHALDVHDVFSRGAGYGRFNARLTMKDMELGDYRFSVPLEIAKIALPACTKLYLE